MQDWLTHALTGLGGIALPFLLRWRKLTGGLRADMLGQALERIAVLEARTETLHADLLASREREIACQVTAARQEEQIKALRTEVGELRAMLAAREGRGP